MKNIGIKNVLIALNVVLMVGFAGAAYYFYNEKQDLEGVISLTTEEKNQRLVDEINEVYDLPDEDPVVAIVTNVEEFKATYPTFDNAEQGDYLLFFRKNRLNVLYRQDERRVVKTADVVVPIAVEIIGPEDALEKAEERLADFGNQITVTRKVDNNVNQTFVFDVDADQPAEAQSIAEQLGTQVGSTLPTSISPAEITEIVIVVANVPESEADSSE